MRKGLFTGPDAGCPARVLSELIFSGPNAYADLVNFTQAIEMVAINSLLAEHFDFRVALRKRTEIELHPSRQSGEVIFHPRGSTSVATIPPNGSSHSQISTVTGPLRNELRENGVEGLPVSPELLTELCLGWKRCAELVPFLARQIAALSA